MGGVRGWNAFLPAWQDWHVNSSWWAWTPHGREHFLLEPPRMSKGQTSQRPGQWQFWTQDEADLCVPDCLRLLYHRIFFSDLFRTSHLMMHESREINTKKTPVVNIISVLMQAGIQLHHVMQLPSAEHAESHSLHFLMPKPFSLFALLLKVV